ncbi:MAG TPA: chemotaxis protein CheX [Candidatus Cloacimonadota bacterium]|nr:chemotaxis protein CheX [Candidatus Cloacimonadota bacterium]
MKKKMKNLRDVTSNIIERMFFMNEETIPDHFNNTFVYCSSINHPNLKIELYCGEELANILTKNFLGIDEVNESDILDALKEILNMIAGNYVGEYLKDFPASIPVPNSIVLPNNFTLKNKYCEVLFYESLPFCISLKE